MSKRLILILIDITNLILIKAQVTCELCIEPIKWFYLLFLETVDKQTVHNVVFILYLSHFVPEILIGSQPVSTRLTMLHFFGSSWIDFSSLDGSALIPHWQLCFVFILVIWLSSSCFLFFNPLVCILHFAFFSINFIFYTMQSCLSCPSL